MDPVAPQPQTRPTAVQRVACRIERDEEFFAGCQRVICEEIDGVLEALCDCAVGQDNDPFVHRTRKHLKNLRALLRFLRPAIGEEDFIRMTAVFRRAASHLAPARDAAVCAVTLEKLGMRGRPKERKAIASLRASADTVFSRRTLPSSRVLGGVGRSIAEAGRACLEWKFCRGECEAIEAGLSKIYLRAREAARCAEDSPSTENLHIWRRRTKEYCAILQIFSSLEGKWIDRRKKWADKLGDVLGKDHDLAVLHALVTRDDLSVHANPDALRHVLVRIESKRGALQRKARKLGRRLYRDKPRKLAGRMSACWSASHRLQEASP